ncbi:hypothetical protein FRC07_012018 [Ceratobasidium sp. 392]|nr:hypothetical protein FRC07_012018 [Ceratobasidium sp. 392]
MSWEGHVCRIISASQPRYNVIVFGNSSDEGTPIACIDDASTPYGLFNITALPGGDKYEIRSVPHPEWGVGANPDNLQEQNYPFTTLKDFAWSIESAGNDLWKIHIANMNDCWYLPGGNGQVRVLIRGAGGGQEELWRIVPVQE